MKNYDYIKNKFDEDDLQAPESLNSEKLRAGIQAGDGTRIPAVLSKPKRRWVKPLVGLAACTCIAFVMVPAAATLIKTPNYNYLSEDENGLYTFKNSSQLNKTVKKIINSNDDPVVFYTGQDDMQMSLVEDAETPELTTGSDHSKTYKQVEGVDEADIVKTDGKFIYHVSDQENQVIITSVDGDKTRRVSSVRDEGDSLIRDIYITSDKLIVISSSNTKLSGVTQGTNTVESGTVTVYDITDRSTPRKTGRYSQTGSLLSSRMTGGRVVLVTNQYFYNYIEDFCVPSTSFDDEDAKAIDVEDIRCVPSPKSASYTTVGLIDTSKGTLSQKTTRTGSVLGSSDQIYCNTTDLYITALEYNRPVRSFFQRFRNDAVQPVFEERTQVLRVNFGKGNVDFAAAAIVDGRVNDQFSMDASEGIFKIATTSQRDGHDVNNLFVLDEKLKEIGALRNFARDEHIEAVRYIGNLAYVITYEQTDPLFIIDLSEPASPNIKGHVKISGFSTLLVPVDNDHILGFGYSTTSTEFGEATDGVKLALFDVSDPANPKVSDSREFPGMSSPIQYDHKALLVGPNGQYYAFPFSRSSEDVESYGIKMFDARDGKIDSDEDLPSETAISRCIYIKNYLYGIADDDSIEAFRL